MKLKPSWDTMPAMKRAEVTVNFKFIGELGGVMSVNQNAHRMS